MHFKKHLFCRNNIYLKCRCNKADRYLLCQEVLIPTTTQALDSQGGAGVVHVSDVNFDEYPSYLSWQVLNKNIGRMADRTCSILYWSIHSL